jgi:hypothetical protein
MPFARLLDPVTSHEAADSVANVTEVQATILSILREKPMSDEYLVIEYQTRVYRADAKPATEQSIRSRRAELARLGLVSVDGYTVTLSGRRAQVWRGSNV